MTNDWFRCTLGDAMLAQDSLDDVRRAFQAEYEKAGNPEDMAVFVRHESEGRLHCEVVLYFPPAAAAVAAAFDAEPCAKPSPRGLDLLAGAQRARSALFAGREE